MALICWVWTIPCQLDIVFLYWVCRWVVIIHVIMQSLHQKPSKIVTFYLKYLLPNYQKFLWKNLVGFTSALPVSKQCTFPWTEIIPLMRQQPVVWNLHSNSCPVRSNREPFCSGFPSSSSLALQGAENVFNLSWRWRDQNVTCISFLWSTKRSHTGATQIYEHQIRVVSTRSTGERMWFLQGNRTLLQPGEACLRRVEENTSYQRNRCEMYAPGAEHSINGRFCCPTKPIAQVKRSNQSHGTIPAMTVWITYPCSKLPCPHKAELNQFCREKSFCLLPD